MVSHAIDGGQREEVVLRYHERTKHYLDHYARALGYLDWLTQPDPFRRFDGAGLVHLDESPAGPEPSYDTLFGPGIIAPEPLNRATISQLFFDSLALSAWKTVGTTRWSLRVNPSSGNLHPTEGYLVTGPIDGLTEQAGVFHYAPYEHALEERFVLSPALWQTLTHDLPDGVLLVGLCSIYWRESWKYGERAFRYCQHDVGHAMAAVTIAARILGWRTVLLGRPEDASIATLLGVDGQQGIEAEHPDCLIAVLPGASIGDVEWVRAWDVPPAVLEVLGETAPAGVPKPLSQDHHNWEVIDTVSEASIKTQSSDADLWYQPEAAASLGEPRYAALSARQIVRQRRSALAMDGCTDITRNTFYRMLKSIIPDTNPVAFQPLSWRPCVHPAVFVHRVTGLAPGLYLLVRQPAALEPLMGCIAREFVWERAEDCPSGLTLYCLQEGDFRSVARTVSCHQDIAGDGAFSLAMLAEFEAPLLEHGAWFYKRLYWETGVIGQVLYLEAEAAGISATGIGCFFDDVMHELLGIRDRRFQSLYHFTVGGPVEDPRLSTDLAYAHKLVHTPGSYGVASG
jgi:SagB-type dehydrogenase family enzyme